MDKRDFFVITIYIAIVISRWSENGMVLQSYESIYNKKLRYEHHNENFKESILRDITPFGLRIKKNPGINVISTDLMNRWNSALKIAERSLVELLREETEKVVASLDTAFENSLKEVSSGNVQIARARVIKNGKHLAETLQKRRNSKCQKFERQMNFDLLKFVNVSDRERRSKKQRANELKLERLINDESNDNLVETVFPKKNESKDLVNVIGDHDLAVGNTSECKEEKIEGENGKNAVVNLTTKANRTLIDQQTCLDKNSNLRNSLNFPKVSYATILKQPIMTVRPKSAPVYAPPQVPTSLNVSGVSHDLTQGDDSLLETLQSLGGINDSVLETESDRIKGSFSSDSVFNLSKKVLSKTEIKILEKGLGFSPTPSFINEADLQRDFDDFARKMRCKWYFRNENQDIPSESSTYKLKSTWNPPKGSPALELFLSKVKEDIFSVLPGHPKKFNLSKKESSLCAACKMTEAS